MENNIVELKVKHEVLEDLLHEHDQNIIDMYIKQELAQKLSKKMIEEDLIQIECSWNLWNDPMTCTFTAKVKFIQE